MSQYSGSVEPYQDLDNEPVYNMKAVVEATGISAATLRAWERRYGALSPGRTDSGYRLYSARDIAVLRWLKARVDEGMSISQAISLLTHQPARRAATRSRTERAARVAAVPARHASTCWHALIRYDEAAGRPAARRSVRRLRPREP